MTEPSDTTGGRSIVWPRGRVLGGSSSINGLIFIRGQREGFDDWERLPRASGWNYRELLPTSDVTNVTGAARATITVGSREFEVSDLRTGNPASAAWVEAGVESGLPRNVDFNGATTHGVGAYQLGIGRHWRSSSASAFLRPVARRQNLTVITGAQASKVMFRGRVAAGVEWIKKGRVFNAPAEREVVLCSGALQSPQLLQLSGVGPAELLRGFGIPLVADAPEVGRNLQDHYQARMIVRLKQRISLNDQVRSPSCLAKMGLQWLFAGSGPLSAGAGQVGGAACTEYAVGGRPDVQFNVMPLSVDKPGDPLHRYSGFTASVWQCHGQSRGHLAIRSTDPFDQPRIRAELLCRGNRPQDHRCGSPYPARRLPDRNRFADLWDIRKWFPAKPSSTFSQTAGLWDFSARATGGTVFHCAGTCRMGSDDTSVLDPQLRVRGVERLRVIDASVMPLIHVRQYQCEQLLMIGEKRGRLWSCHDGMLWLCGGFRIWKCGREQDEYDLRQPRSKIRADRQRLSAADCARNMGIGLCGLPANESLAAEFGDLRRHHSTGCRTAGPRWSHRGAAGAQPLHYCTWHAEAGFLAKVRDDFVRACRGTIAIPRPEIINIPRKAAPTRPCAPEDGKPAARYVFMRRLHSRDRRWYCVISIYLDERIFRKHPKRSRKETAIPILTTYAVIPPSAARAKR